MTALDLVKEGDLDGALAALQNEVKADPADAKLRVFLFQLLSTLGDWHRAVAQLRICAQLDVAATPMAQTYREAIACELVRERVFRGETGPLVFGEPQQWIALLIEALGVLARGDVAGARSLREEAFEHAPSTPGSLNGERFAWIADADMRLGPVLEIILNGRYYWLPFNRIVSIKIEKPVDLRDRVWTPVVVKVSAGGEMPGFIPTRYPGAAGLTDHRLKLARATEWVDIGGETYVGHGQRVLATDSAEVALMDVRELTLDVEVTEEAAEDAAAPVKADDTSAVEHD